VADRAPDTTNEAEAPAYSWGPADGTVPVAGDGSALPAPSRARTHRPAPFGADAGLAQGLHAPVPVRHSKLAPASDAKLARVTPSAVALASSSVSGGMRSTRQVATAGAVAAMP